MFRFDEVVSAWDDARALNHGILVLDENRGEG
jgi:hypothetical protein